MSDQLLLLADLVLTMDAQGHILENGGLLIEGQRILAVGARSEFEGVQATRVEMPGRLLMPGLINAHTHTPMTLFRGLAEGHSLLTLEGWLRGIRRWELRMHPLMVAPAVAVSCAEMVRTGTTCFADQYFYMDAIVPVVREIGMRAVLAYGIVELGDEAARDEALRATTHFLDSLRGDARLNGWIGPHALFVDNQESTIQAVLALADAYAAGLHIHFSTAGEEDAYCRQRYGVTAVQRMQQMGLLERRLLAAHCLTIPVEDLATLAAAPAFTAVVAASACMRAGRPAAPLKHMLALGIGAALGTDNVAANNSYDLFSEMRALGKLMSYRDGEPNPVPAKTIVEMATTRAAMALGLGEQIGSLEAGKQADVIALDLNAPGFAPRRSQDIYTALVYAVSGDAVTDAMVDGQWLMRDKRLLTVDYARACEQLEQHVGALLADAPGALR
jgi:5-methylthioadenosine/S-adenosylhomocysteine deaminase